MKSERSKTIRAWLVHAYTASGLIAAFAAFQALLEGDARTIFLWQSVSLLIDATDGPLARRWEVTRYTPSFNGRKLDDIIDFINYTFIPVLFAYRFGLVAGSGMAVLLGVLFASAYGFCQEQAKTEDGYFTGFPSYWNILVFYLYLLAAAPWISALVLGIFAILVFVPLKYITWRSPGVGRLTFFLSMVWFISLAGLLLAFDSAPRWAVLLSLLYPVFHLGMSVHSSISRTPKSTILPDNHG